MFPPPLRMSDPHDWQVVLDAARATERVPELLGIGSHLLATATRPPGSHGREQE